MKFFFSCDWGTSAFRLRLVDALTGGIMAEIKTGQGIAGTYESWKLTGQNETGRMAFYQRYLFCQMEKIMPAFTDTSSKVILSGMASSSIGMMELPYKDLPFQCSGKDLLLYTVPGVDNEKKDVAYEILVISGVRSEADAIRGEETALVGCSVSTETPAQLFIFPGTHSKHITVINGEATGITTYMTGELFELLSKKSILASSVEEGEIEQVNKGTHFAQGVIKGASSNLANSIFHVRTNQLFKKNTLQENYHYLSGLLIGHELQDITREPSQPITLVCSKNLRQAYVQAIEVLGLNDKMQYQNLDEALVKGHWKIMQQHNYFL